MAEVRKDDKGRLLRAGESQRPDKRYCYQYTDVYGKRKSTYSWHLTEHDRMIPGKKKEASLREKERKIQADLFDQIIPEGGRLTVKNLVQRYISIKENTNVRESTRASYRTVLTLLKKDSFGGKRIDKIRISDAKEWLIKLQRVDGKGYSTIRTIRGVLRPAFQLAVDDDLIRKNPLRHTFCSRMAAKRMNPKTLQYIMGHSDIAVTLNTYTHLGFEEAASEVKRMAVFD